MVVPVEFLSIFKKLFSIFTFTRKLALPLASQMALVNILPAFCNSNFEFSNLCVCVNEHLKRINTQNTT